MANPARGSLRRRNVQRNNAEGEPQSENAREVSSGETATTNVTARTDEQQQQGQPQPQQPTQVNPRNALIQFLFRTAIMYFIFQMYTKPKSNDDSTSMESIDQNKNTNSNSTASKLLNKLGVTQNQPKYYSKSLLCHWPDNVRYDVRVFTSLDSELNFRQAATLLSKNKDKNPSASHLHHLWSVSSLSYSTRIENYHSKNFTIQVPQQVSHHNSSWYAHVFIVKADLWNVANADTLGDDVIREHVLYTRHELVKWIETDSRKKGKHLLGGKDTENDDNEKGSDVGSDNSKMSTSTDNLKEPKDIDSENTDEDTEGTATGQCSAEDKACKANKSVESSLPQNNKADNNSTIRYNQVWKPSVPIVLVYVTGQILLSQLPPTASEMFEVSPNSKTFYPPMHVEEFWHLRDAMKPMNETVDSIFLEISFKPVSILKWSMFRQFDNVWRKQTEFGTMGKGGVDEIKRMFIETNPILLGTTMLVSLAHSVLEGLAFKNDISHWRNIKSMEGVSVRSMMWKIGMELVIFLYLWDNDTSWMIILGNGFGVLIEIWKLRKAVKFENFGGKKLLGFIPWFEISNHESYSKETKEYDDQAMIYLEYVVYPLVIGYAIYSLKYDTHKSWYSWIVNSLVGAVYAFGFIMMFPQIFINYKLKSVAHIPMKAMMYKTLNTIIDDLFSFIIKMPWLHRLACFRDDIVFLVLLYQRHLYPTDYSRVNEFGQQFDKEGSQKTGGDGDTTQSTSNVEGRNESNIASTETAETAEIAETAATTETTETTETGRQSELVEENEEDKKVSNETISMEDVASNEGGGSAKNDKEGKTEEEEGGGTDQAVEQS